MKFDFKIGNINSKLCLIHSDSLSISMHTIFYVNLNVRKLLYQKLLKEVLEFNILIQKLYFACGDSLSINIGINIIFFDYFNFSYNIYFPVIQII